MSGSGQVRRLSAGLALAAIGGLMAACGSGAAASDNPAKGASAVARLSGQALVDAAKSEGALTWYTSYTDTETNALIKVFNQAYPGIKVTTQQGTASDLTARLETEHELRPAATHPPGGLRTRIERAVGTKWAGHKINQIDFVRPKRSMSQIGG